MQPERPTDTSTEVLSNTSAEPSLDRQHGPRPDDSPAVALPSAHADTGATTAAGAEQAASDATAAVSERLRSCHYDTSHPAVAASPEWDLNAVGSPSPPPAYTRITEYEQAATPPTRKREGPEFQVIKKPRNPNDKRSPVQELPNEVLTHVLAHLAPNDLASVSIVSKRFHDLVTGPHAWRSAFAHFFPGPDAIHAAREEDEDELVVAVRSERRAFTRLTSIASWRSEYITRTRLLRSLARGKPVQAVAAPSAARSGQSHVAQPIVMYSSQLFTTINHLHATFGTGLNKRPPRFIHGADDVGAATSSDPSAGKVDHWGLSDPQVFPQFTDRFAGDAMYGLGPGEVVGVPNVMDVSQPYGMVYGEGSPGGMIYFRSTEEMRGRLLPFSDAVSAPGMGIPRIASSVEAITSIWIAKSAAIPSLTDGMIGIISGSSLGVLTTYSLGSSTNFNAREQRHGRGEMTARWVLSPGVPIIAIAVDPDYTLKRQAQNRIWAVVLNALGEVFTLTKFPSRQHVERGARLSVEAAEVLAWQTGRSVYWSLVESSRRVAKPDPYAESGVDGSYSPRSSWNGMCLGVEQIKAETVEIEAFTRKRPKDFQKACQGWDMRRRLEVDFAGDDGNNAGEHVTVIDCGLEEDQPAAIKRYTRCRLHESVQAESASTPPLTAASTESSSVPSLFGGRSTPPSATEATFSFDSLREAISHDDFAGSSTPRPMTEEWRVSSFLLDGLRDVQIIASAIDCSTLATQTISEDALLSFAGRSTSSSPSLTPLSSTEPVVDPSDIPGQRARLFAIGTKTGSIICWDARANVSKAVETVNTVSPVRLIHTESPQISCLAMSSLYLVHGGNDGLVQAWDPLASSAQPIRTLNSRFSSRARRRLVQAQASPQGVGINLFAAGAICLDPDATVLRGLVSLGTHLRYWSYSSSAADQYKSSKRRLRRSERGSNNGGERFSGATRSNLKDYIASEKFELDREKDHRTKEAQRFAGRFGTELLGGSEEELMAYAAMLSQEALEMENMRRSSDTSTVVSTAVSADHSVLASTNATPARAPSPRKAASQQPDEDLDPDIAEAIRQSLASTPPAPNFSISYRQNKSSKGKVASSGRPSPDPSPTLAGSSQAKEMSDLDFAMQLSLAEEQSRREQGDGFPDLPSPDDGDVGFRGKGKGRQV